MAQPTLTVLRQLAGDLVRAAVAVQPREPLEFQSAVASATETVAYSQVRAGSHSSAKGDGTRSRLSYAESAHDHGHSHGSGSDSGHGHSHGSGSESGHGHSHGCGSVEGDYMLGLHIAAIFIILAASAVGTLIPIVGKRVPALRLHAYVYAVGKSAATGVVLAVSMIHMINHASVVFGADCIPESFREMYEGWAFLFAMMAAIVMHAIDGTIGWIAERWSARAAGKALPADPCHDSLCNECVAVRKGVPSTRPDEDALQDMHGCVEDGQSCASVPQMDAEACGGHQHGVAVPEDMAPLQRVVAAVCMEFGVTLHSVFVGLAVAVSNGTDLRALIIALVFHQLFEGMAVGSRLVDAKFSTTLDIVLALVFSLSAPAGMAAAAIAVSVSPSAMSGSGFATVVAVLDTLCGGILLYLAFTLLLGDFVADVKHYCGDGQRRRTLKKVILFVALWVGMGLMALVGNWL